MNFKQTTKLCFASVMILIMTASPLWAAEFHQDGDTNIYLPVVADTSTESTGTLQAANSNDSYYEYHVSRGGVIRNAASYNYTATAEPSAGRNCPTACNDWHRGYYIFDISQLPVSVSVSNLSLPYIGRERTLAMERFPITVYAFNANNFDSLSTEDRYNRIGSGVTLGTIEFDYNQQAVLSSAMQNLIGDAIETYRSQNAEQIGIGVLRSPESDVNIVLSSYLPWLRFDYEPTALCEGHTPTIYGTEGNDVINGTNGVDIIHGLGGDDTIKGKLGNDIICGGDGDDYIEGNNGRDKIYGGEGEDRLHGGWKDDKIYGGSEDDYITGGKGDDELYGEGGDDDIFGQNGRDDINGGEGTDDCDGGWGNDDIVNCE